MESELQFEKDSQDFKELKTLLVAMKKASSNRLTYREFWFPSLKDIRDTRLLILSLLTLLVWVGLILLLVRTVITLQEFLFLMGSSILLWYILFLIFHADGDWWYSSWMRDKRASRAWKQGATLCIRSWTLANCLAFMRSHGFSTSIAGQIEKKEHCLKKLNSNNLRDIVYEHLQKTYTRLEKLKPPPYSASLSQLSDLETYIYDRYWDIVLKLSDTPQSLQFKEKKTPPVVGKQELFKKITVILAENPIIHLNDIQSHFPTIPRAQLVAYLQEFHKEKNLYFIENVVISPAVLTELGVIFTAFSEEIQQIKQRLKEPAAVAMLLSLKQKLIALRILSETLKNPYLMEAVERADKDVTSIVKDL